MRRCGEMVIAGQLRSPQAESSAWLGGLAAESARLGRRGTPGGGGPGGRRAEPGPRWAFPRPLRALTTRWRAENPSSVPRSDERGSSSVPRLKPLELWTIQRQR